MLLLVISNVHTKIGNIAQKTLTVTNFLTPIFENENGLIIRALEYAETQEHVMKFTKTHLTYYLVIIFTITEEDLPIL